MRLHCHMVIRGDWSSFAHNRAGMFQGLHDGGASGNPGPGDILRRASSFH